MFSAAHQGSSLSINLPFFSNNRKAIYAKKAVEKMAIRPKSKIKGMLNPTPTFDVIISSEKSAAFKKWIYRTNGTNTSQMVLSFRNCELLC